MTTSTPHASPAPLAAPCAACGAYSLPGFAAPSSLFAVSDALVLKALEAVGKRIIRVSRRRYNLREGRPWHESHLLWRPDEVTVDRGLVAAWDLVPVLLTSQGLSAAVSSQRVVSALDAYTRELLSSGTAHRGSLLRSRFESALGIHVPKE